ncbi:MAG TPA: helix-turn-helix domain-containing protein, partial [Verrucomicrobiae bacterium]
MSGSRLHTIEDWVERGQRARYHSAELAVQCQISLSHLGRFFRTYFYRPPQHWLDELRICDSTELLVQGRTVKETAFMLSYFDPSHFSHTFKNYYG